MSDSIVPRQSSEERPVTPDGEHTQRVRSIAREETRAALAQPPTTAQVVAAAVTDALAIGAAVTLALVTNDASFRWVALMLVGLIAGVRITDLLSRGKGGPPGVGGVGGAVIAIVAALTHRSST